MKIHRKIHKRKTACQILTIFVVIIISIWTISGGHLGINVFPTIRNDWNNTSTLLNLRDFAYIINNEVCDNHDIFAVVIIHSHPANRDRRDCMRQSIPSTDLRDIGLRRVFLLARAEWDDQPFYRKTSQERINDENLTHKDIIQGNFKEHYRNLTYKHIMGLKWVTRFCPKVKYVIKMDDDVIVDLYRFRDRLKYHYSSRNNLILGLLLVEMRPRRNPENKWFMSELEYAGNVYPNYVSGWAYAVSTDAVPKIVSRSYITPFNWIDDLLVTGLIAEKENIVREGLNRLYTIHDEHLRCCVELPHYKNYYCDFYVGPSEGDVKLMQRLLEHARSCFMQPCLNRNRSHSVERSCVKIGKESGIPNGVGIGEIIKLSR